MIKQTQESGGIKVYEEDEKTEKIRLKDLYLG